MRNRLELYHHRFDQWLDRCFEADGDSPGWRFALLNAASAAAGAAIGFSPVILIVHWLCKCDCSP